MSYEDDYQHVANLLTGTGIDVLHKRKVKKGKLTNRLSVIVASKDKLALSFQQKPIGHIVRTEGQNGKIWQAQEISTIKGKDLHRVCFELASLHPELD